MKDIFRYWIYKCIYRCIHIYIYTHIYIYIYIYIYIWGFPNKWVPPNHPHYHPDIGPLGFTRYSRTRTTCCSLSRAATWGHGAPLDGDWVHSIPLIVLCIGDNMYIYIYTICFQYTIICKTYKRYLCIYIYTRYWGLSEMQLQLTIWLMYIYGY